MIALDELQWDSAGDAGSRLTATVPRGTCAVLAAPERSARMALEVISGRAAPVSGRTRLDGRDLTGDPLARRRLAFCAHDLPRLPLRVDAYLELSSSGRVRSAAAIAAALRLSLLPAEVTVDALESNEWQTLAVAAALASGAPILLLHAPFTGGSAEDHARRRALLAEARHEGRTVIVTGVSGRDALVDTILEAGR